MEVRVRHSMLHLLTTHPKINILAPYSCIVPSVEQREWQDDSHS